MNSKQPDSPKTILRNQFYATVCDHLDTCHAEDFSKLVDVAVSVGLGVKTKTEWAIYLEMAFDSACVTLLLNAAPETLQRFTSDLGRIVNVSKLMGGPEKVEGAYQETRAEVWRSYSQALDEHSNSIYIFRDYPTLFDVGVNSKFSRIVGKLVTSAANAGNFVSMADSSDAENRFPTRTERKTEALTVFISTLNELAGRITELTEAPEPECQFIGRKVRLPIGNSPLEEVAAAVRSTYADFTHDDEGIRQHLAKMTETMFEDVRRVKISHAVETCVSRFVDGEMDYETPGSRGPGRASEYCPRLGALHREMFKGLTEAARDELRHRIRNQILSGFVFAELILDISEHSQTAATARDLYEQMWMQVYYTSTYSVEVTGSDAELKSHWHATTCKQLHDTIVTHGGTWFDDDRLICTAYFDGGMILRQLIAKPLVQTYQRDAATGGAHSALKADQPSKSTGCLLLLAAPLLFTAAMLCIGRAWL